MVLNIFAWYAKLLAPTLVDVQLLTAAPERQRFVSEVSNRSKTIHYELVYSRLSPSQLCFNLCPRVQAASAALHSEATPTPKGGNAPLQQPIDTLEQPRHSGTFWAVEPPLPIVEPGKKLRNSRFVPLCFDNPESSYRDISTYSLTRGIAVLTLCKIKPLVKNADTLYSWSRRLLGPIPALVMRHSFFAHFCAGEDQEVRCDPDPTHLSCNTCNIP